MERFISRIAIGFLILLVPGHTVLAEQNKNTDQVYRILREIDDLWRGESSYTVFTMRVKTAHYTRQIRMEGWSKGKERTLVRIISPLKEKGTATLKSGNSIYSYLPRTDRTVRLTSGMMMGSWMGSHFTNDDLVKESRREDDYDPEISFEGERDGQQILEFTLTPKPDAPVVWGKIVLVVRKADYLPISEFYFDEDLQLTRSIRFSKVKLLGGAMRPTQMRIVPSDKPTEYTELIYEKLELDIKISDAFFSLSRLKRK